MGPTGVPFQWEMGLVRLAAWGSGLWLERRLLGPTSGVGSVGLVNGRACILSKVPVLRSSWGLSFTVTAPK